MLRSHIVSLLYSSFPRLRLPLRVPTSISCPLATRHQTLEAADTRNTHVLGSTGH